MFAQLIEGPVHDEASVHRLAQRWLTDLAPQATGWLGTTYGITHDGVLLLCARFSDADAAAANSSRREQHAWWEELVKTFDAPPQVTDCSRVSRMIGRASDRELDAAGFVQAIRSRIADHDALEAALGAFARLGDDATARPDIIDGLLCWHDDSDGLTELVYFTSEAEAREQEAKLDEPGGVPAEVAEAMQAWTDAVADVTFRDLRQPHLHSPA